MIMVNSQNNKRNEKYLVESIFKIMASLDKSSKITQTDYRTPFLIMQLKNKREKNE